MKHFVRDNAYLLAFFAMVIHAIFDALRDGYCFKGITNRIWHWIKNISRLFLYMSGGFAFIYLITYDFYGYTDIYNVWRLLCIAAIGNEIWHITYSIFRYGITKPFKDWITEKIDWKFELILRLIITGVSLFFIFGDK